MDISCLAFAPVCLTVWFGHPGDAPYSDHGKWVQGTPQSPTAPTKRGMLHVLTCDPRFCAPYTRRGSQNLTGEALEGPGGHVTGGRPVAGKGFAAAFASGSGSH